MSNEWARLHMPGQEFSRVDSVRFLLTHALNDLENRKSKR